MIASFIIGMYKTDFLVRGRVRRAALVHQRSDRYVGAQGGDQHSPLQFLRRATQYDNRAADRSHAQSGHQRTERLAHHLLPAGSGLRRSRLPALAVPLSTGHRTLQLDSLQLFGIQGPRWVYSEVLGHAIDHHHVALGRGRGHAHLLWPGCAAFRHRSTKRQRSTAPIPSGASSPSPCRC